MMLDTLMEESMLCLITQLQNTANLLGPGPIVVGPIVEAVGNVG